MFQTPHRDLLGTKHDYNIIIRDRRMLDRDWMTTKAIMSNKDGCTRWIEAIVNKKNQPHKLSIKGAI